MLPVVMVVMVQIAMGEPVLFQFPTKRRVATEVAVAAVLVATEPAMLQPGVAQLEVQQLPGEAVVAGRLPWLDLLVPMPLVASVDLLHLQPLLVLLVVVLLLALVVLVALLMAVAVVQVLLAWLEVRVGHPTGEQVAAKLPVNTQVNLVLRLVRRAEVVLLVPPEGRVLMASLPSNTKVFHVNNMK